MTILYILLLLIVTSPNSIAQPDATFFSLDEALKQPENVYRLDLSYQGFTEFPVEITQLKNLKRLNISHNEIEFIPEEIGALTDLRRLLANDNQITVLPEELFTLSKLKKLYLNDNRLTSVPPSIAQLTMLKRIELVGNKIDQLPDALGKLDYLIHFACDKPLLRSLSPSLDSLWTEHPFPNWYVFDATPDSIEGRPLDYYLNRKDIDSYSKRVIQGEEILYTSEVESLGFIDSILTTNTEIQPYYIYLYEHLDRDFGFYDNPRYERLEAILEQRVKTIFLNQPCKIAHAFLSNETYTQEAAFGRSSFEFDSLQVGQIMSGIEKDCPELLEDEYSFYVNFMNSFLEYDQQYGSILVELEGEKSLYYDKFHLITVKPDGSTVNSYGSFTKRDYFRSMKPGKYTFYLYPSDRYEKEEKEYEWEQFQKDTFSLLPYRPQRYSEVWLLDTTLTSLRSTAHITIPIAAIPDTSMLTESSNLLFYDIPHTDVSYPGPRHSGYVSSPDSCGLFDLELSENVCDIFMEEVYHKAMGLSNLHPENRKMLEDIKVFLSPTSEKNPDRVTSPSDPMYPTFRNEFKSGGSYVSIFQEARWWNTFSYGNWEEELQLDQKDFYESFVLNDFHVFYCNDVDASSHQVTKYDDFKDACAIRDAFPLFKADSSDNRIPAFASRHNLVLEYGDFEEVNDLLLVRHKCKEYGGYCDIGESEKAFARLKTVPNLFFTATTIEREEDSWPSDYYPARGLYMKTEDGRLIRLWHYYMEHVECSCI